MKIVVVGGLSRLWGVAPEEQYAGKEQVRGDSKVGGPVA